MVAKFYSHHRSDEPRDVWDLIPRSDDPAFREITLMLGAISRLGMDPTNMHVVREAIAAARRLHAKGYSPTAESSFTQDPARMQVQKTYTGVPTWATGPHEPLVYYMRLGTLCKIGTSTNLETRLATLNPEELLTVEAGGRDVELARHIQFKDLRQHGEWFRYEGKLQEWIADLKSKAA